MFILYKELLHIMICPQCGEELQLDSRKEINGEVIEGTLRCTNNHKWKIEEGIINFEAKEQTAANNWSEVYSQINYDELDKLVAERTPELQLSAMEAAKAGIIALISRNRSKKILDIATGRGMLLTKLVESFGSSIDLVCVDLSFDVLKYDRIKAIKLNPDMKINYIACDATRLPFLSNSFDLAVSFFGIQNMGSLASEGIKEGVRVSQNGLANVGFVIRDDNPKIDELNKLLIENGYDFKVDSCTETNFYKLHKLDDNFKVEVDNVFEGIAEKDEHDIVPIEGEWFAAAISKITRVNGIVNI